MVVIGLKDHAGNAQRSPSPWAKAAGYSKRAAWSKAQLAALCFMVLKLLPFGSCWVVLFVAAAGRPAPPSAVKAGRMRRPIRSTYLGRWGGAVGEELGVVPVGI